MDVSAVILVAVLLFTPLGWVGLFFIGLGLLLAGYGVGCIFQGLRGKLQ